MRNRMPPNGDLTHTDREILEILEQARSMKPSGFYLKPTTIAKNISRHRVTVSRRLQHLLDLNYVERDPDGWYRITKQGTDRIRSL